MSPETSRILKHGPQLTLIDIFSQSREIREEINLSIKYRISMKNFQSLNIGPMYKYEYVFESFDLSDEVEVPAGEYRYTNISGFYSTSITKPLRAELELQGGQYYDGTIFTISASPSWSLSSFIELNGTYMYNRVDFAQRDQLFVSHVGRLKAELMFTTSLSASVFVQYNSAADYVLSNFRFRYNPREGNDLWLVYNEGTNTDLRREIPYRPSLAGRTIMLKYTYTFRL